MKTVQLAVDALTFCSGPHYFQQGQSTGYTLSDTSLLHCEKRLGSVRVKERYYDEELSPAATQEPRSGAL